MQLTKPDPIAVKPDPIAVIINQWRGLPASVKNHSATGASRRFAISFLMKSMRSEMLFRPYFFSFLLATSLVVVSWEASCASGPNKEQGTDSMLKAKPGGAVMFDRKKITESDGREFWVVHFENATYRIPEEYVANVPSSGVAMSMHWPTGRGPRVVTSLGVKWDPSDGIRIFLSPPSQPPGGIVRDSYVASKSSLARYEKRPSPQYSGLIEYFSVSDKTGKTTVHYFGSAVGTIRTPTGNPYLCSVLYWHTPPARCDTHIRLPEGSRLRITLDIKHLADWQRIYSAVLKLVESSRSN